MTAKDITATPMVFLLLSFVSAIMAYLVVAPLNGYMQHDLWVPDHNPNT